MGIPVSSAGDGRADLVPADMDELARVYGDYIRGLVRKAGIPDQDVSDSVQQILWYLGRPHPVTGKNVIGQFDPEHLTEHQGKLVKTRFSTFLGRKVLLYCRGERGRVLRRDSRELKILDAQAAGNKFDEMAGLQDILLGGALDDYSALESGEVIAALRAKLAAAPRRSARDGCDLVALFDEIAAEVAETGEFSYAGLQARFGISGTTAGAWLARLRAVLAARTGRPVAVAGGVALTAEQAAWAVKVLLAAGGTAVAQPLRAAGHPLKDAEKGWYHPVARAELKKFPGIAVAPGTRSAHHGHVKLAVIHYLERVLAEAGAEVPPAPPPPAVPAPRQPDPEPASARDILEAELWHVTGITPEAVDRILATAERVYAV